MKVKVLELSEEFEELSNDKFEIFKSLSLHIYNDSLSICDNGDKWKHKFPTEQEAINWVEALFSLRGE